MLTEKLIRDSKHGEKIQKLYDRDGLYLAVSARGKDGAGSKRWYLRYKFKGQENVVAIGKWPIVTLSMARDKAIDERRAMERSGSDPATVKRAVQVALHGTFGQVADEWLKNHFGVWQNGLRLAASERYAKKIAGRLRNHVYPYIGALPIATITPNDILDLLRRIEKQGRSDVPIKTKNEIGQIFNYAILSGKYGKDFNANPVDRLKGALKKVKRGHYAALITPEEVGKLLLDIDNYRGCRIETRMCMKLAAYLFQRPSELRLAQWPEFDLNAGMWTIPEARMKIKGRGDHKVPLPRQAVALLRELHAHTGDQQYVFVSTVNERRAPISNGAVNVALDRLGYRGKHRGHGFRSTGSTLIEEELLDAEDSDLIFAKEAHLAHGKGASRGPYARGSMLKARRELLQKYADYLDSLRDQARSANTASMYSSMSDSSQQIA